jgi:hypothetical protein
LGSDEPLLAAPEAKVPFVPPMFKIDPVPVDALVEPVPVAPSFVAELKFHCVMILCALPV